MRISKNKVTISFSIGQRAGKTAILLKLLYRWLKYGYAFRKIELTRGKYAVVDPEDYEYLSKRKWHTNYGKGKFYAVDGRNKKMHRILMNAPKDMFVDHIDGNGLNNRKANLRLATASQNNWNSKSGMGRGSSKYKGVGWHKRIKKWYAIVGMYGKKTYLGYFTDEKEAARAYDDYVKKHRGEFGVLNFPDE